MAEFEIDMSETSTEQSEGVNIAFAYTDNQGNTHFLSQEEAEQMGLTNNDQQSQNNPFAELAGATNAGRFSDNEAELNQQEETTGSLEQEAESNTEKVEEAYNGEEGANPGNTETGATTVVSSNFPEVTRSGVPHQHYIHAALAGAVALTVIGLTIKTIFSHGVKPFTRERRRETKLNAQSAKYFAAKSQYRQQQKFMASKEEKKEDKIAKDIKKVQQKIGKGKLSSKRTIRFVKAFAKGSKNKRYYENNIVDNSYDKSALKTHRNAIKYEALIAKKSLGKQTKHKSKQINKYKDKQKIDEIPLGSLPDSIHFAAKMPDNMYSNMSAESDKKNIMPLYIHRAVTNIESLNITLDRAHKVLPFADKKIRVCKIDLYDRKGTMVQTIAGTFDNEIGFKVVKAALLNEVKQIKSEKPEISEVVIKESVQGLKTEQTRSTYNINVDNKENNISEFNEELDKANATLKKFNSLYAKTKTNSDLSM